MGRRLMPMYPPPGSPNWMYVEHWQKLREMQKESENLAMWSLVCGAAFVGMVLVCVIAAVWR
jgi:hypothetical protein